MEGIANREYHPTFMEPDVAMLFKKSEVEDIDLGLIESNLRRAIEEVSIKCHLKFRTGRFKSHSDHQAGIVSSPLSYL